MRRLINITTIIQRIKITLWKLSILKEDICPVCGDGMLMHWTSSFPGEYWTCNTDDCIFNGPKKRKVKR